MLIPVITIQPLIFAPVDESGVAQRSDGISSVYSMYKGQNTQTHTLEYSELQESYAYIRDSPVNVIVVFDSTDNITTAAANLFEVVLENQATPLLVPITHLLELSAVLESVREDQVVIEVIHGVTESFMINRVYTNWAELDTIIKDSDADRHVLASCFSSILDTDSDDLRVKGLETLLDYEIAVPMLSLYVLEFLYEKDGIDRTETGLVLQGFFEEESELIITRLLSPKNVLGTKMTIYQRSEYMEKIRDLIDVAIYFLKTNLKDLARNILNAIFSLIPESIYDASEILNQTLAAMEEIDLSALDGLPTKIDDTLDGKGKEFEKEVKKGIKVGVLVKFHIDKNLDGKTQYHIKSTYLQLGWKLSIEHWTPFQLGPIPLNMTFNFNAFQMFDILLEYLGHDPNWVSTEEQPINPDMYEVASPADPNDSTKAVSLLAYTNIEGPYGEFPIEAWWGAPLIDIPLCTRSYGGLSFTITVKLALSHKVILEKIGHTDDAIGKAIKKICDKLTSEVKFGQGGIHGYFTLTGSGMKITILYANWIGIEMDLKFKFGKNIEIGFNGYIKLENLIMGEITWDLDGLYLSKAKVFWPRIRFGLKINLKVKLPIPLVPPIDIPLDLAKILGLSTHYFPFGPHTDHETETFGNVLISGSWATYDDAPWFAKVPIPVNDFVMKIVGALAVLAPGEAIEDKLNGAIDVVNGTITDQTPPVIYITTPAYTGDPLSSWPDIPDGTDPNLNQASLVGIPSGTDMLDVTSGDDLSRTEFDANSTIASDDMSDGAAVVEVNKSQFIPLWGDNASIRLYTFDKHDGDNNESYVKRVTVKANFQSYDRTASYGIGEYRYALYSSYTFNPTGQRCRMRLFYTLDIYERIVMFYDDQGNLFEWSRTRFSIDEPVRKSGFTKWVESSYILVVIEPLIHTGEDVLNDGGNNPPTPSIPIHSRLFILGGEIEYDSEYNTDWDSNTTLSVSEMHDGGIFLDESTVEWNGLGDGPIIETRGWEGYWDLKIPLHKFYREGLIGSGLVTFTATAYDSADLSSSASYSYYVDVPPDTIAPTVSVVSSNMRDVSVHPEPSPTIAQNGIQYYEFDVVDTQEYISYTFDFGAGTSTRGSHTGIPYQWPNQTVIHRVNPYAIVTDGAGLENAYRYYLSTLVPNTDSTYLATDVFFEGDYSIHLYVDTNVGVDEIVYSNLWTSGNPYISGTELIVPTGDLELNDGNWHTFVTDIQADLRNVSVDGFVQSLSAFEIRGNAKIDNIRLDGENLMDAELILENGWIVSDDAPAGATIKVERSSRIENVDATFMSYEIDGNTQVDQEQIRIAQRFRYSLDTNDLPDGYYVLTFTAYDGQGLEGTCSAWIIIDNNNPTAPQNVHFEPNPSTNPNYGYDYIATWDSADDGVGIHCYIIKHDGTLHASIPDTSWNIRMISESAMLGTWEFIAKDYAGRTATTNVVFTQIPDYDGDGLNDFREWDTHNTDPLNADSDSDGLPDGWEVQFGLNPNSATDASGDLDNDGLSNYEEYEQGTTPNDSDFDNDNMMDGWEVDHGFDPLSSADAGLDPDSDGRTNVQEHASGTDPHDADSDNDQLTDGQEATLGTNPLSVDSDSDSLWDYAEVHDYGTSPTDSDSDNDGLSDGTEVLTHGTNPLSGDSDSDGMPDAWEVSHSLNPVSHDAGGDADNDGLTNLQEYQMGLLPRDSDYDNDGLNDRAEISLGTNPKDYDSDNDYLSDGYEVSIGTDPLDSDSDNDSLKDGSEDALGTDPLDSDTDNDGLSDYFELYKSYTDPLDSDSDNDGYSDGEEWSEGTDPNNASSYPGSDPPEPPEPVDPRDDPPTPPPKPSPVNPIFD
jgi:hypothetical protein